MPTNDEELLITKAKKGNQEVSFLLDPQYLKEIINHIMRSLLLHRDLSGKIFIKEGSIIE